MAAPDPISLAPEEWAVLAAVAEGPVHGNALAQLLAAVGELGQVWTVPRANVYYLLKKLTQLDLIVAKATERSDRGPDRTIFTVSLAGRQAVSRWLDQPVDHVRDVRSLFLLKLALLYRAGRDPRALVVTQRQQLLPLIASLEAVRGDLAADGFDRVLMEWRLTSSRATVAFLDSLLEADDGALGSRR